MVRRFLEGNCKETCRDFEFSADEKLQECIDRAVPGKPLLGVGGAMDLATGANKLIITMFHTNKDGSSKIVNRCTLPLTALKAVDMIITELAVFAIESDQLILKELMPGAAVEQVREHTEAVFLENLN